MTEEKNTTENDNTHDNLDRADTHTIERSEGLRADIERAWKQHGGELPEDSRLCRRRVRPFPAEPMRMWPISTRVNKPENDDPAIVEPIKLPTA